MNEAKGEGAQAVISIGSGSSSLGIGEIPLPAAQMSSPPPNDDIADAIVISSLPFSDSQDTSGATIGPDEEWAECDGGMQGTVWYSYTPPADGAIAIDTYGSDYDTVLSVWTGEPDSLMEGICNDDTDTDQSAVTLLVQAGVTYWIRVADRGEGGMMQLNADVGEPPPNDDIYNATEIPGLPFVEFVDTTLATTSPDDPPTSCGNPDFPSQFNSVWFRFTPLEDDLIAVQTTIGEDYDIVLALWTGSPGSLEEVACSTFWSGAYLDSVYLSSQVSAGTTYWIEVAQNGKSGDGQLMLLISPVVPPPNDDIENASPIDGVPFHDELDTTLATSDPNDPPVSCGAPSPASQSNSVWYRFDATEAFPMRMWGSSTFEAALVVWEGEPGSLTEMGCIVIPIGDLEIMSMHLEPGKTYWIEAVQYGDPGGGRFGFDISKIYPSFFDSFDSPWVIDTIPSSMGTNTMGATIAPDDPPLSCGAVEPATQSNTVWFSYTPAMSGGFKISTKYTDYETVVGVWTGAKGSLNEVACARHPGKIDPDLAFTVEGGTTYWIEVAQFGGLGGGNLSLFVDYAVVPGCQDDHCVFTISTGSDDAGWVSPYPQSGACTFQTDASLIYFGQCPNGDPITSGFRFSGATLPQGATITDAYLAFRIDAVHTDELTLEVFGEAADNAETFSESNRPDQRPETTASVAWDIPASDAWNYGENRQTPDLSNVIQEIVDRPGWMDGNALAIIIENVAPASGSKLHRRAYSFEAAGDEFSKNLPHLVVAFGLTDPDLSTLEAFPDTVVPDGTTTSNVTVTLVGTDGEPLPDTPVYLHVSGTQNIINGEAVPDGKWVLIGQTAADGTITATLASTAEEVKTIQARGGPVTLSNTASVTYSSTFLDQLLILLAGETATPGVAPGKNGTPEKFFVGEPVSFQILAVDENWNLETGFSGTIEIGTTDPLADIPTAIDLISGKATVVATWGESGAHTLTVTQTGDPSVTASETVDVLGTLVVSDGETVTIDDIRYAMTENVAAGVSFIPLAEVAGLLPGHEIVIITMEGAELGTFDTATIESVATDGITLSSPLSNSYDGMTQKVVVQRVPSYPNIHVQSGGTLTASPWDGETGGLLFVQAGNITVDPNGQIKVDGLGYGLGEGPGAGSLDWYRTGGGGYGGYGGNGATVGATGGNAYGSVFEPTTLGSGAGNMAGSGNGSGAVHLVVSETFQLDGTLSANGDSSTHTERGGGAGGSLWIEAASLTGNGAIEANGGDGGGEGGGGGGGRIAIDISSNAFTRAVHAYGGAGHKIGGPGTIYYVADNKLVVNNNGNDGQAAALMEGEYTFTTLELSSYGHLYVLGEASILTLDNDVVVGDGTAVLKSEGTINAPSTLTIEGYALDIAGQLVGPDDITLSTDGRLVLRSDTPFYTGQYIFNSITVADSGTIQFVPYIEGGGIYTNDQGVTLQVNNLTVDSGGLLTASGLGYGRGEGPGAGSVDNYRTGGGGHGGQGGDGARPGAIGGIAYGSVFEPTTLGSGAGDLSDSGAGAGAIHLVVSDIFLLDGTLAANGDPSTHTERGGGAGGSLWIQANTLTGGGVIEANGGDGGGEGGGGGGGRIAVYVTSGEFAGMVQALGGVGYQPGGEGGIYLGDIDPNLSTLAVDPAVVPTDGISVATITIALKNSDGEPVPNTPVSIALASGWDAFINEQLVTVNEYVALGTTDSGGIATATLRAETAGVRTFKARAGLVPITQQGTVEFVPGPMDVTQSFVDASPGVRPADGATPATIIVTARDGFGNPIQGLPVEIFATGDAVATQPTELTNSLGHTTGSVTDTTAETVTVTAAIDGVLIEDDATITFIGADLKTIKSALAPSNYEGLSSTHALSGGTITYTLQVINEGLLDAQDGEITDTLPAGLVFSSEDSGYPFLVDGQILTWQIGMIPMTGMVSLDFEASIDSGVLGIVTNTFSSSTSTTEGDLDDNSATRSTTVELPRPAMALSPSGPTVTVLHGEVADMTATIRNTGGALMSGIAVAPPPTIPWVTVDTSGVGDVLPLEQVNFMIQASPPADQTPGYYRDFITATDDYGNLRRIALTVHVTAPVRNLEVTVNNDQGALVPSAVLTLVKQEASVIVTQGVVETFQQSAQGTANSVGVISIVGLEIGKYDYTLSATDHVTKMGVLTVEEGEAQQQVSLSLIAQARMILSPSSPVIAVLRGDTQGQTITLTNIGAAPLTGVAIQPSSIPWVTIVAPSPFPAVPPNQSQSFTIFASPSETQTGDIFQDFITVTANDGISAQVALSIKLTSEVSRDVESSVFDTLGNPITVGGTLILIQQNLTTIVLPGGEEKTFNQQFKQALDASGHAFFAGLEPGEYTYIVQSEGYEQAEGTIIVSPGSDIQQETIALIPAPFLYSWEVVPIEQEYEITLTLTFDTKAPAPAVFIEPRHWTFQKCDLKPIYDTIKIHNPTPIRLDTSELQFFVPGVNVEIIGALPESILPQSHIEVDVVATLEGEPGEGKDLFLFTYDAVGEEIVTYTVNPSSSTSPSLQPGDEYTREFLLEPADFKPGQTYTHSIGQFEDLDWISLSVDPPNPQPWESDTQIKLTLTAVAPEFLAEGTYHDEATISVAGGKAYRDGTLSVEAIKTADGLFIHTTFELGPIPYITKEGQNSGRIVASLAGCGEPEIGGWIWGSFPGGIYGVLLGPFPSVPSLPQYIPPPIYGYDHQQVRLEISQHLMLEGEGFSANLTLTNITSSTIQDMSVDIRLVDEANQDRTDGFRFEPETVTTLGDVSAGGSLSQDWLILPKDLGITSSEGENFAIRAIISYSWGGLTYSIETPPELITVYPAPDLVITYELPLPDEPCTIFVLKTTIENQGDGPARNLRLSSSQPEIVDNKSDLIIGFSIVAASINGAPAPASLDLKLGDLASGKKLEVIWLLGSSLPGRFVEFTSDYRQSNYVGTYLSPLISEIHTVFVPGSCQLGFAVPDQATLSSGHWDLCFGETYNGTQGYTGGPINTRTGGMDFTYPDLSIPTTGGPLAFRRHYASLATDLYTTELGYGWTHSLDSRLIFPGDPGGQAGQVLFKAHTANLYSFFDNQDGTYTPYPGLCGSLTRNEGPQITYTVVDRSLNTYVFDETGKLLSRSDPGGHLINYVYDLEGRLIQANDSTEQRFLKFTYDEQGRISSVTDHIGREVTFGYDPAGDLVSATDVTDVLNDSWTYIYDDAHRLTQVIDPRGITFEQTEYDEFGRAIAQYNGLGEIVAEIQYGETGSTTIMNALGNQVVHTYNTRGTLIEAQDALDGTVQRVYDDDFRPISIEDEGGKTTYLSWTENGINLESVEDPEGNLTILQYDENNNLTSITAPGGSQTSFGYTGALMTESIDGMGNISTFGYSPEGYLESITDPLGQTTVYSHNEFSEVVSLTDPKEHTTEYYYDDIGLLAEMVDPLGRITRMDYDAAGRLTRVTRNYEPDLPQNDQGQFNIITTYAFDEIGNLVEITDTYGRTTQYLYDNANRLTLITDPDGNKTSRDYDAAGNLITLTDPLGRTTAYEYDVNNQVVAVIDPLGKKQEIVYNPDGTVASRTDTMGRMTQYVYNDAKQVVAVVDPEGNSTTSTYDPNGNLIATTDGLGRTTTYVYDSLERLVRQIDPDGKGTEYAYDAAGNRTQSVNRRGYETLYAYDALNLLISITNTVGNISEFEYDSLGRRIATTDAAGNLSSFEYDALDRLIESTDPLGNSTFNVYDALGNLITSTNPNGNTYSYTYDALNRLRTQTDPSGNITSYLYDAVGNRIALTDANGNQTLWTHDQLNRAITTTDPNGVTQTYEYDPVGNRISATDGLGNSTAYGYDNLNRLKSITDPLGNSTEYTYDAAGNRVSTKDAKGAVTDFEFDELNRVTVVLQNYLPALPSDQETNVRTEYIYDANGNLTSIVDANGHTTTFTYDVLDRLTSETDPLGNPTSYAYDAVGNRISMTDQTSATTTLQYDPSNRLTTIDYPDPDPDVVFTYDAFGNRVSMSDGIGSTSWIYDALNRPFAITDPFGDTTKYDYDAVGNRVALTYPDGKIVQYTYDPGNQLTQVTDWSARTTSYVYDAANKLNGISWPNGASSSYDYDPAGRLSVLSHVSGPETLSSFAYSYDAVGNRTQAIETILWPTDPSLAASNIQSIGPASLPRSTVPVRSSAFDPSLVMLGPLALMFLSPLRRKRRDSKAPLFMVFLILMVGISMGVAACTLPIPTPTPTLTPSPTATITPTVTPTPSFTPTPTPVPQTATIDYVYDPLNRLKQADFSSGEFFHYTYDAVGNRLTEDSLGGLKNYQYDPANRLIEADGIPYLWDARGNLLSDGSRAFSYDHDNRLISVTGSGSSFSFAYNGLGNRVSQSVDGITTNYTLDLAAGLSQVLVDGSSTYVYGLGRIGDDGAEGYRIHLEDGLGSLRQLANEAGAITLARYYEPFGEILLQAGTSTTPYGFAGEQRDNTGFVYLRSRYLNPDFGRFITVDPWFGDTLLPQTLNDYSYVNNNPVTMTDPSGRCYPPLEFLRDIEPGMCATMDQAAFVLYAPPGLVTEQERWMARIWITSWATLHAVPVVGGLLVAGEVIPPMATWIQASWPAISWQAQLMAYRLMTNPLLKYLAASGEAYLLYQAIVCGNLDAVGWLTTGWYVTGQSALQSVLEEGLARLHNYWLRNLRIFPPIEAYNARTSTDVTISVLDDLDPGRFDPESRFREALYLSEHVETASMELSNRGDPVAHTIRYYVDLSNATVLDLTDPRIASAMGYTHDVGANKAHQAIAETARILGFNVIRYYSFQGPGYNYALLDTPYNPFNFNAWLKPLEVIPPIPLP